MRDHGIADCYMQEQGYMTKGSREHSSENSWWGSICMCKRGGGNFLVNKMQNKYLIHTWSIVTLDHSNQTLISKQITSCAKLS